MHNIHARISTYKSKFYVEIHQKNDNINLFDINNSLIFILEIYNAIDISHSHSTQNIKYILDINGMLILIVCTHILLRIQKIQNIITLLKQTMINIHTRIIT